MKSRTKKRLIALGVVIVLAAGGVFGLRQWRSGQRAQLVDDARERGMRAYDDARWQEAMDSLGYYVGKGGRRDAEALFRLGDARRRVPKPDGSHITDTISLMRDALVAAPGDTRARMLLLDMYEAAGMWPEAIDTADILLRGDEANRDLLVRRISYLAAGGQREQAERAARDLAKRFPSDPEAHRLALAMIALYSSAPGPAMDEYIRALPEDLHPIDRHLLRTQALVELRRYSEAFEALKAAASVENPTPRQLADVLDMADVFSRVSADAMELARGVEAREDERQPLSPEAAGVLIGRSWRRGTEPRIVERLGDALRSPADLSDATLGWTLIAGGPPDAQQRAALAGALGTRTGATAEFWQLAVKAYESSSDALPTAMADAQAVENAAGALPLSATHERALAAFLLGSAQISDGGVDAGMESIARAASAPGWRIAMLPYLDLLVQRGEYQAVLSALDGTMAAPGGFLAARALVGIAEGGAGDIDAARRAVSILDELRQTGVEPARVESLSARASAVLGDEPGAKVAVDALLAMGDEASVSLLTTTASSISTRFPELSTRLLAAAQRRAPSDPDVLYQRAVQAHASGQTQAGVALLTTAIAQGDAEQRLSLRIRLVRLLDTTGDLPDAKAIDVLRELAQAADSLAAQRAILNSPTAWGQEELVRSAINRVRALTSDASAEWRLAEARRLLTFNPNPQRAGEALTPVLEPILRTQENSEAFKLASAAWEVLGNRDQAIAQLERAAATISDPTEVYPRLIALLRDAGRTDDARARLGAFRALNPAGRTAQRSLASLLENFAMWDDAVALRTRLAESGTEEDLLSLGASYANAGRLSDARRVFDAIVANADASPNALQTAASFFGGTGEIERGERLLESLAGKMDESRRIVVLGNYLSAYAGAERARRVVREFADAHADADAGVWLWLARSAIVAGRPEEAREAVRAGLKAWPDAPALLAMRRFANDDASEDGMLAALASVAEETGGVAARELIDTVASFARGQIDKDALAARLERLTRDHPTYFDGFRMLVGVQLERGEAQKAIATAVQAMRQIPGDPRAAELVVDLYEDRGLVAAALGRRDEAAAHFNNALSAARQWHDRAPGSALPADIAIARLHLRAGRPNDARSVLNPWRPTLLDAASPTPDRVRVLAWATAVTDDAPQRREVLDRAARDPIWAEGCIDAAREIADAARSREWLDALTPLAAVDEDRRLMLAEGWLKLDARSGSGDDARRALQVLDGVDWDVAHAGIASRLRGNVLERLAQPDEAILAYRAALDAPRVDRGALASLAELLLERGRPREALEAAQQLAASVTPETGGTFDERWVALQLVARCQVAAGNPGEGVKTLDAALALAPRQPALLASKAEALILAGDRAGAASVFAQVRPEDAPTNLMLVVAERLAARPADVEWLYRAVLERDRGNMLALNNLAFHLLTHGGSAQEAVDLARRAADRAIARDPSSPDVASVHETLGLAQLANGTAAEAEASFRIGLRIAPASPDLLLGLAEALERQGKHGEARSTFARIGDAARAALTSEQQVRYQRLSSALDQ